MVLVPGVNKMQAVPGLTLQGVSTGTGFAGSIDNT